jgi:hypothetical protein
MKNAYRKFLLYYSQRTSREKLILIAGGICIVLIILYIVISPVFIKLKKLDRSISEKRNELLEVRELRSMYRDTSFSSENTMLEKDVSLLSVLQGITSKLNITIQSFRPSETDTASGFKELTAEVKFSGVTLKELTDFLYFLEKDNRYFIGIKKFHARTTFKDPNRLDVDMTIVGLQSK